MRITYSPRAVRDLIEIGDYLSERNPSGAVRVEQRIRKVVELIADFPASGRERWVATKCEINSAWVYPYWVFYTTDNELIVLHIRHRSREPIDPSEL